MTSGLSASHRRVLKVVFDLASVGALALVAVSFGMQLWQRFHTGTAEPPRVTTATLVNWTNTGIWTGPHAATVRIVNFTDYSCHFCARQDSILDAIRFRYPDHVAVITKLIPNPQSEIASRLAIMGYCASLSGHFGRLHPLLYRLADRNATEDETMRSLRQLAGAEIHDSLGQCMSQDSARVRVRADVADGKLLNMQITPVLVINGLVHPGVAEMEVLDDIVLAEMRRAERDFLQKSQM